MYTIINVLLAKKTYSSFETAFENWQFPLLDALAEKMNTARRSGMSDDALQTLHDSSAEWLEHEAVQNAVSTHESALYAKKYGFQLRNERTESQHQQNREFHAQKRADDVSMSRGIANFQSELG